MKKFYTVLLLLVFSCGLTTLACADVAWGGMAFGIVLIPVLVIAVLALAIGLLVRAISRLRNKKKK